MTKAEKEAQRVAARKQLEILRPGARLLCLQTASASNATKYVRVFAATIDDGVPTPAELTRAISYMSGNPYSHRRKAIAVGGFGFCPVQAVVDSLSLVLFRRMGMLKYSKI